MLGVWPHLSNTDSCTVKAERLWGMALAISVFRKLQGTAKPTKDYSTIKNENCGNAREVHVNAVDIAIENIQDNVSIFRISFELLKVYSFMFQSFFFVFIFIFDFQLFFY